MGTASDLISVAKSFEGYLEKANGNTAYYNSKTANAGRNNFTLFGNWYGMDGVAWCDIFVSYCAEKSGNASAIGKFAYCPSHVAFFSNKGQLHYRNGYTPKAGDIIFFDSDGSKQACHVGIVYAVDSKNVYTIEGNTGSGNNTVIANGGGVFCKQYALTSNYILCYGSPAYDDSNAPQQEERELFSIAEGFQTWANGSTSEPVYNSSYLDTAFETLPPYATAYCVGRIGGAYLIYYHNSDDPDNWEYRAGWVEYDGKTTF